MQVASDDGGIRVTRLQKSSKARIKSTIGHTEKRPVPQMQRASDAYLQTPVGMFPSNIFLSLDQTIFLPDSLQVLSEDLQAYSVQQARKSSSKWRHCRESNSGCWIQSPK